MDRITYLPQGVPEGVAEANMLKPQQPAVETLAVQALAGHYRHP